MRKILLLFVALSGAALANSAAFAAGSALPVVEPDDRILGQATAPITIFEFASLTCPHCAEFDAETMPQLKTEWLDTGKAKLVYRDYPLDQVALRAAVIARCMPPERFFPFIDALFRNQVNWALSSDTQESLSHIARLAGMSQDQFNQCSNDQKGADRVVAERLVAQDQYGVDSTPTFFVNGTKVVGAQSYANLATMLTAAAGSTATASAAPPPAAATPATPPPPAAAAPVLPPPAAAEPPAPPPAPAGWLQSMIAKVKHFFGWP